jgi:hypothetical protein
MEQYIVKTSAGFLQEFDRRFCLMFDYTAWHVMKVPHEGTKPYSVWTQSLKAHILWHVLKEKRWQRSQ